MFAQELESRQSTIDSTLQRTNVVLEKQMKILEKNSENSQPGSPDSDLDNEARHVKICGLLSWFIAAFLPSFNK